MDKSSAHRLGAPCCLSFLSLKTVIVKVWKNNKSQSSEKGHGFIKFGAAICRLPGRAGLPTYHLLCFCCGAGAWPCLPKRTQTRRLLLFFLHGSRLRWLWPGWHLKNPSRILGAWIYSSFRLKCGTTTTSMGGICLGGPRAWEPTKSWCQK